MKRQITDFERGLFLATRNNPDDFSSITVRDGYSTVTYTRDDIEEIGKVVAEEQLYEHLLSQGQEAFEAEIERQRMEKEEWEQYVNEQCELAEKLRGGHSDDAA